MSFHGDGPSLEKRHAKKSMDDAIVDALIGDLLELLATRDRTYEEIINGAHYIRGFPSGRMPRITVSSLRKSSTDARSSGSLSQVFFYSAAKNIPQKL